MADSMSYLYTIGGYATLFGVGYVIYQVSTQKNRKRAVAPPAKAAKSSQAEPRKEDKKKKQRMESFTSEAQEASKKAAKAQASAPAPEIARTSNAKENNSDDVDNLKFARQLAKAQEGTKFAKVEGGNKQREKSVKQSRANQMAVAAEEKESAPSSTTGADADDDQSPITSPEVGPVVAGDVSDMLEAVPARPAVLRVTDAAPKKQQKKAAKAPEPVETKKQRQNRKKAEAAKAVREEAEKERKVLEEKQRRTARIAEGRAAKDGSQFVAANGNKSAWTEGAPSSAAAAPAAKTNGFHQPLDTFEPATTSTTAKATEGNWIASVPSEEEQMEMLKSDEDEWSTVKTKSSKKAAKNESSVDSGDEPTRAAVQPKQVTATVKDTKPAQSFGAFSALSTKDEPAEEEEEEEWDV